MAATDDTRPFFFVHVMKTGGTSFVFHLLRNFAPVEVYPHEALDRANPSDVEPYASVPHLLALTPERQGADPRVRRALSLCGERDDRSRPRDDHVVRDPVDRTISVLKHFKRLFARYRDLPLDEIYDDELVFRLFVENFQTKVFAIAAADRPQAFVSGLWPRRSSPASPNPAWVVPAPTPARSRRSRSTRSASCVRRRISRRSTWSAQRALRRLRRRAAPAVRLVERRARRSGPGKRERRTVAGERGAAGAGGP